MDFLKTLFGGIYERVIVNWMPTLIGIAAAIGIELTNAIFNWTQTLNLPSWSSQLIALAVAAIGAYLKRKVVAPPV